MIVRVMLEVAPVSLVATAVMLLMPSASVARTKAAPPPAGTLYVFPDTLTAAAETEPTKTFHSSWSPSSRPHLEPFSRYVDRFGADESTRTSTEAVAVLPAASVAVTQRV